MAKYKDELEPKLAAVTNQLLDLGKRNRLLNYKETGLKSLNLMNKNMDEVFRGVKNYRDLVFLDVDKAILDYHNSLPDELKVTDDMLQYDNDKVMEASKPLMQGKELIAYKKGYGLQRVLKSLMKDHRTSLIEKGINPLYISFGFVFYKEEEVEYKAPLLLIPIELSFEEGIYQIRMYEDDIILNPTLKYYLFEAYNIELIDYDDEALPTYLDKLLPTFKDLVRYEDGISLGIYSFYKMNMYNDLIANKDLVLKNNNIRALLGETDSIIPPTENEEVYPVVNCDSSQLEAIRAAANGKSFTLQGPPGSGKSQTITNMIATLLGHNKKILFVSEKIAALNVVYENLRRAKLSDFALELHSNKANKKEFIDSLYKAATLPRYELNLKTRFLESKYQMLRNTLSGYEDELHATIPGLDATLLDLYNIYLSIHVDPFDIKLELDNINIYIVDRIMISFNEYIVYSGSIGCDYRDSMLYGLNLENVNNMPMLEHDLERSVQTLIKLAEVKKVLNSSSLGIKYSSVMEVYQGISLSEKFAKIKTFSPFYFNSQTRKRLNDSIEKYLSIAKGLDAEILKIYKKDVIKLDLDHIFDTIKNAKGLFKGKEYKESIDNLTAYRIYKAKPEVLLEEIPQLQTYKRYYKQASSYIADIEKLTLKKLEDLDLKQIILDLRVLEGTPNLNLVRETFEKIKAELLSIPSFTYFKDDSSHLVNVSKLFYKKDLDVLADDIDEVLARVSGVYKESENIFNYNELTRIIDSLTRNKAIEFLNAYIDSGRDLKDIGQAYKKTFVKQKIEEIHAQSERLSKFRSDAVDDIIQEFRDLDERMLHINRDYIIANNSTKRQDSLVEGSQFKILDKEYNKLRRQLPIRSLLEKTFELALDIKPVFLMSPLSVSTYLASELNMFDCVIFDEASQIFACDAFGSIYRAKQCIVIGDTKQMPPTSFFQASTDSFGQKTDEEEVEEEEYDMESILDKASYTFETSALKWHYRSRSEELIVFSNKSFYDSNLITIPQSKAHKEGFGIDYYYVEDGLYDAQTRTNPIEAQKICDMVFEHFDNSQLSIGVVAFSNVQAELISSLIEKRLKREPKYEKFFSQDLDEPCFVKNLESVQGDERDRIIFSICYGYNKDHKFYQRFGPINASGGERRLNVAITRAKFNISIVASIHYSDIRDNPDSLGVTLLKDYLKFAENVIYEQNYSSGDSTIKSIIEYINDLGYEVVHNYGTSAFKVDLAVKKDDDFVLAIMIDGNNSYSESLTDNYRLERMLLERQGWRYYKLFTTAWINDREGEMKRIKDAINGELVEGSEYRPKPEVRSYLRVDGNDDSIDFDFATYQKLDFNKAHKLLDTDKEALISEIITVESPIHKKYLLKRVAEIMGKDKPDKEVEELVNKYLPSRVLKLGDFYLNFKISNIKLRLESDRDFPEIYIDELADGIYTIVDRNNGISEAGCFKTLANMLGYDRVTAQSKTQLSDALDHLILDRKIEKRGDNLFINKR